MVGPARLICFTIEPGLKWADGQLSCCKPPPRGGEFSTGSTASSAKGQVMLLMKDIRKLAVSHAVPVQLSAAMLAISFLAVVVFFSTETVAPASAATSPPTIVLIGGDKQGDPRTEHDYPDGILAIE